MGSNNTTSSSNQGTTGQAMAATPRKFTKIGNIKVSIINESFLQQKADVIVNCASADLDLKKGRGASALAQTAGPSVQADLNTNYTQNINEGDVAVSIPGNLKCRKIYHVYLTKWNHSTQGLQKVITNCLTLADQHKVKTIVFPSLGTGFLNYPYDEVIKTAFTTIEGFTNNSSSIDTIIFAVYDKATFKVFLQEIRNYRPGSHSTGRRPSSNPARPVSSTCVSVQFGPTVMEVVLGELPKQQVEVIVNSAPFDLNLSNGGLSEALLKVAGQSLQDECMNNYPNGISTGQILTTKGYGLSCGYVYHGCLPDWSNTDHEEAKEDLFGFMMGCLEEANNYSTKSIAFPTLGSGSLNFPADVVAERMVNCVKEFIDDNPHTTLSLVRIVIYHKAQGQGALQKAFKDTCQPFNPSAPPVPPVKLPTLHLGVKPPQNRPPPPKGTQAYFNYMYEKSPMAPSYWTKYDNSKPLKIWNLHLSPTASSHAVYIPVDRKVFKAIENIVLQSWNAAQFGFGNDAQGLAQLGYKNIQVTKIERIENPVLFEKYFQNRAHLFLKAARRGKPLVPVEQIAVSTKAPVLTTQLCDRCLLQDIYPEVNEYYTFHGTPEDRVAVITAQGLDNRLAGNTVIGNGIYTAESSTKSDQYADYVGKRDKINEKKMFLTRICLGEPYILNQKPAAPFKRPPCKTCRKDVCADNSHEGNYDSMVVEKFWIFREFVVFEKDRCYPEYLITYKRV